LIGRGGREAMSAVNQAARSRQVADDAVSGGFLTVVAGVLLMIPGFFSDLAALTLLLPPVRALVRPRMQAWGARRPRQIRGGDLGGVAGGSGPPAGAGRGPTIVDGTVVEAAGDVTPVEEPRPAAPGTLQVRPGDRQVG